MSSTPIWTKLLSRHKWFDLMDMDRGSTTLDLYHKLSAAKSRDLPRAVRQLLRSVRKAVNRGNGVWNCHHAIFEDGRAEVEWALCALLVREQTKPRKMPPRRLIVARAFRDLLLFACALRRNKSIVELVLADTRMLPYQVTALMRSVVKRRATTGTVRLGQDKMVPWRSVAVLNVLNLRSCGVDGGALRLVARAVRMGCMLHLDLTGNNFVRMATLIDALRGNTTLKTLVLRDNRIGLADALELTTVLGDHPTIELLDIGQCFLPSSRHLWLSLARNTSLRTILADSTSVDSRAVEGLLALLSHPRLCRLTLQCDLLDGNERASLLRAMVNNLTLIEFPLFREGFEAGALSMNSSNSSSLSSCMSFTDEWSDSARSGSCPRDDEEVLRYAIHGGSLATFHDQKRQFSALMNRNRQLTWCHTHAFILEATIVVEQFCWSLGHFLPPYVMLAIVDFLPYVAQLHEHSKKIDLIDQVLLSMRTARKMLS